MLDLSEIIKQNSIKKRPNNIFNDIWSCHTGPTIRIQLPLTVVLALTSTTPPEVGQRGLLNPT